MDERKYLVGEVSRITGISKDTLRFWDKIGLLKPKCVDPNNNYRYYTYDQFWSMDIIMCCRSLNIPIDKIRTILSSSSNDRVLALLLEQQKEAEQLSRYYQQVTEDIAWYVAQDEQMRQTKALNTVSVKHFPKRTVLYGDNAEETHAYHLKLQELCRTAVKRSSSIRRGYGFLLDETKMQEGGFVKRVEYIRFDQETLKSVPPKYLTILPDGNYACCTLRVVNDRADFTPLLQWFAQRELRPGYVIADEIGLQLFEYLDHGYLCEVKALLY